MAGPEGTFTEAQKKEIILQYGALRSPARVSRWFRKKYPDIPNSRIPKARQFKRLIERFKKNGSIEVPKRTGRTVTVMTEENIESVRVLVGEDWSLTVEEISRQTGISVGHVWTIMRKKLKLYPYKPHEVIPRSFENMQGRVDFCNWLMAELTEDPEFLQLVLFSDEKKFVKNVHPNRQNERYWAMSDPLVMEENRVQGGKSQMCWAGLINGRIILHWFDEKETVNQHSYLAMLKTVVWPKVRSVATARGYVFQQDGAPPHTTQLVRQTLRSSLGHKTQS